VDLILQGHAELTVSVGATILRRRSQSLKRSVSDEF
jgi:hypothetical protein